MSKVGLIYDPIYLKHDTGAHPENGSRLVATVNLLEKLKLIEKLVALPPRAASVEEVSLAHSRDHISHVQTASKRGGGWLDGDTYASPASYEVALYAVGGALEGLDAVMTGKVNHAFALVRPPGHHATTDEAMGFCLFNNIAIGARVAQARHGVKRILIADWDVHHGNGTQDVFWSDGSVLFFDTHQDPWYPGTGHADEIGEGKGRGLIVNRPFPAGAGRAEILGAFREVLVPAADEFKPQLVLISAGFDSRIGDPLGKFTLTDRDFADLTEVMLQIAAKHAGGRLVSVLEGGYNLEGLASAAAAHVLRLSAA